MPPCYYGRMPTVTMTELRLVRTLDRIFDELDADPDLVYTITRYGKPIACIISHSRFEAMEELTRITTALQKRS